MSRTRRVLIVGAESFYARNILRGICAYAERHGDWEFHLEVSAHAAVDRVEAALTDWQAHAVIAHVRSLEVEAAIRRSGLPVVNVSGVRQTDLPQVVQDNIEAGRVAARYFVERGFRNFAYSALTNEWYARQRCQGFVEELSARGLPCQVFEDDCTDRAERNWVLNRRRMEEWLANLPKPVAVMCLHDIRGQEVLRACRRLGIRVPEEAAVIGVDNDDLSCLMSKPPLSSISSPAREIGFKAARLIHQILRGHRPPELPLLVPPGEVVTRQSSDTLAIDDPEVREAMQFIHEHGTEAILVADLLRHVPVSQRSLERRFMTHFGRTPRDEIARVRLAKARHLLANSDQSLMDVARNSGFASQSVFSVFFRRQMNMTPRAYRQRNAMR